MTKVKTSLGVVEVKEMNAENVIQVIDKMLEIAEKHNKIDVLDLMIRMLASIPECFGDAVRPILGFSLGKLPYSNMKTVVNAFFDENTSFFTDVGRANTATLALQVWLDSFVIKEETTTTSSDSSANLPNSDTPTP